ncbi:CII family transcriptional regulator [Glaciimonas sp. PCH181]|uniref:CII family transcriptional regulator n=1 Tax=Glaciimonas sp. PCH181 TaxID=2133943 RepID=UPI000D37C464|nr:CII family transcriptional regulator [Glaciimonas sp. PCH181]PUA17294.1 transcriptional regulator [Glaciimonas sp. PCH181]
MTTEIPVSPELIENTRKDGATIEALILQRLASVTQVRAAACMGVSGSTVSRMTDEIASVSKLLAALGMRVAPIGSMMVTKEELRSFKVIAHKYLEADLANE